MDKQGYNLYKERKPQFDKNILDYIIKELKKGFPEGLIKHALIKAGHDPIHIDFHFSYIQKRKIKLIIISSMLITLTITASFFYLAKEIMGESKVLRLILDADSLCRENDYNAAIEMFNNYLLHNGPNSEVYLYLGFCFARKNEKKEALLFFDKAIELDPDNPYIYYRLARQQCKLKYFDAAEMNFKKAEELDPKNSLFSKKKWCALNMTTR